MLFATAKPQSANLWLDWLMTADQIQFYGTIGFAAFTLYWLIWFWLRPNGHSAGGGAVTQSPVSTGLNSPSVAAHGSTPNFYATPPPEAPTGKPYSFNKRSVEGLHRALSVPPGWNRDLSKTYKKPMPDITAVEVILRIAKKDGIADENTEKAANHFRKIAIRVSDAMSLHDISVWGRINESPLKLLSREMAANGLHLRGPTSGEFGTIRAARISDDEQCWITDFHFNTSEIEDTLLYGT